MPRILDNKTRPIQIADAGGWGSQPTGIFTLEDPHSSWGVLSTVVELSEDGRSGFPLNAVFFTNHGCTAAELLPNGLAAVPCPNGEIWLMDPLGITPPPRIRLHSHRVTGLCSSANLDWLASIDDQSTEILVWMLHSDGTAVLARIPFGEHITCLARSPDDRYLAAGGQDGSLRIYETGRWGLVGAYSSNDIPRALAWSLDRLLVLGDSSRVHILMPVSYEKGLPLVIPYTHTSGMCWFCPGCGMLNALSVSQIDSEVSCPACGFRCRSARVIAPSLKLSMGNYEDSGSNPGNQIN